MHIFLLDLAVLPSPRCAALCWQCCLPVFLGHFFPFPLKPNITCSVLKLQNLFPLQFASGVLMIVAEIAKIFKGSISDNVLEDVIVLFRKNHIMDAFLVAFGDKEWEQLISSVGFSLQSKKAISEKIKEEQTEKMSKMQQRVAPKKIMRETTETTGMPKISSFSQGKRLRLSSIFHRILITFITELERGQRVSS